jgi:anhydro-N-acetylmuramic acid kinase
MRIIGLMSGTSLDGLDVALCSFVEENGLVRFVIEKAKTYDYDTSWKVKLQTAVSLSGEELIKLDADYGFFLGNCVLDFIDKNNCGKVDCIASHGHTVFHQPQNKFTLQIGSGAHLFARTQIPVISDFRTQDVAMGGQGAPLVPIGDKLLFSQYDYCLNLGRLSNFLFSP